MAIERKYLAHFIDANFGSGSASYVRLGKDLEEYNDDLSPDVEVTKNILGEQSVKHNGYEVSGSVEPYYAEYSDALSTKIEEIANKRLTGDACKTTKVDVLMTTAGVQVWAYREDVIVVPSSIGGDTSGVQIPFTMYSAGNRVAGTWDSSNNSFASSGSL